jgi:hypothetical protein
MIIYIFVVKILLISKKDNKKTNKKTNQIYHQKGL